MINVGSKSISFEHEPEANCELCNQLAELRPYGPNGENICYKCGTLFPEAVEAGIRKAVDKKLTEAGVSFDDIEIVASPEEVFIKV